MSLDHGHEHPQEELVTQIPEPPPVAAVVAVLGQAVCMVRLDASAAAVPMFPRLLPQLLRLEDRLVPASGITEYTVPTSPPAG